jgi:type III secretion protein O
MTMIDELLFIKEFRERKAETELQKSRLQLRLAVSAEQEAEQTLNDFIEHATQEEFRMFEDLCSRIVNPRDITDVHAEVSALKAQELSHREGLLTRQQQHMQARQVFDVDTRKMRDASTAREKFGELARTHRVSVAREAERKEELELEELASIVREREEWGGDSE